MRYLIDTNIFVYAVIDRDSLDRDVTAILQEPDTVLYMSAESVRELIVGYRNKGLCSKRWKSVEAMVTSIEKEFYIKILPLKKEHMQTYARLEINEAQGHKDPSDLVICRAGASTLSELTALGVPAILVPSPNVTNHHQEKNAALLGDHGAALVLPEEGLDGKKLFAAAAGILNDPQRMETMSQNMAALGIPDATKRIYDTVMTLLK